MYPFILITGESETSIFTVITNITSLKLWVNEIYSQEGLDYSFFISAAFSTSITDKIFLAVVIKAVRWPFV